MEFSTRVDKTVQLLTVFSIVVLVGVYFLLKTCSKFSDAGQSFYFGFMVVALATPYLFAPRRFVIDSYGIEINRLIGTLRIPWNSVIEVKRYGRISRTKDIRCIFGSSGLYGYFGLFWVKGLGWVNAYLTSLDDCVLIVAERKKYLLSPSLVDEFLSTAHSFKSTG